MPLDSTNWPTVEVDDTTALLIRARGFLERSWCRFAQAKDTAGGYANPCSEHAVAWCAYGALVAAGMTNGTVSHQAFVRLDAAMGSIGVVRFNNSRETVEPVLAAFDRAIAAGD